jgi:hypothetical protein
VASSLRLGVSAVEKTSANEFLDISGAAVGSNEFVPFSAVGDNIVFRQPSRFTIALFLLLLSTLPVQAMDLQYAAKVREKVAAHDPAYAPAMAKLIEEADKQLTKGPWTVTDKKVLAPSNDPKDYVSMAPYFWPNPAKPDGLPYVNKDGQVNPGTRSGDNSDRPRLEDMFTAVRTLNIAAYMTGKPEYAKHSAEILRVFFLDNKTGMNPNLNFAQGVRGSSTGRSYGIIDFNSVPDVLDSIKLMEQVAPQDVWSDSDRAGFRTWCTQFLDWLNTSKFGQEESNAKNNHGAWFDATTSCFADFVGQTDRVKELAKASEARIDQQIKPDGSLPLELARTKSWHYSIFALTAYAITTERARRCDVDLWHYKPQDAGAGDLSTAVSYLLHFSETKEPWVRKDIDKPEDPAMFYLQIRSILDPVRDAELCHRIDAFLAADADKIDSSVQVLTVGPVRR